MKEVISNSNPQIKPRRKYDAVFKRDAVAHWLSSGKSAREMAQELGIPVAIYAISAGPLQDPRVRAAVAEALNKVQLITVRDRQGYRLLEDVGVEKDIHLTADPALLIEPASLPTEVLITEGVDFDRHLVGFSVREPGPAAPHISPIL